MEYLTENGIACIASDHRGHGDSILKEEDRGYMYQGGVESILADMEAVSFYINEYYKEKVTLRIEVKINFNLNFC